MALLTIDESKFEKFLEEYTKLDEDLAEEEPLTPDKFQAFVTDSDLRTMVNDASDLRLFHPTRPDVSVSVYLETDEDDDYIKLCVYLQAGQPYNDWPSVNSSGERATSWIGRESQTWEAAARHLIAEVVRTANDTFDKAAKMAREFSSAFPDA